METLNSTIGMMKFTVYKMLFNEISITLFTLGISESPQSYIYIYIVCVCVYVLLLLATNLCILYL